jgi:hypothetical protein
LVTNTEGAKMDIATPMLTNQLVERVLHRQKCEFTCKINTAFSDFAKTFGMTTAWFYVLIAAIILVIIVLAILGTYFGCKNRRLRQNRNESSPSCAENAARDNFNMQHLCATSNTATEGSIASNNTTPSGGTSANRNSSLSPTLSAYDSAGVANLPSPTHSTASNNTVIHNMWIVQNASLPLSSLSNIAQQTLDCASPQYLPPPMPLLHAHDHHPSWRGEEPSRFAYIYRNKQISPHSLEDHSRQQSLVYTESSTSFIQDPSITAV